MFTFLKKEKSFDFGVNKNIVASCEYKKELKKYYKVYSVKKFHELCNKGILFNGDGVNVLDDKNRKILVVKQKGTYINGVPYVLSDNQYHASQYFPSPPSFKPKRVVDDSYLQIFNDLVYEEASMAMFLQNIPAGVLLDLLSKHYNETFTGFCFYPYGDVGAF